MIFACKPLDFRETKAIFRFLLSYKDKCLKSFNVAIVMKVCGIIYCSGVLGKTDS